MTANILDHLQQFRAKSTPFPIRGEIPQTEAVSETKRKLQASFILSGAGAVIACTISGMYKFPILFNRHITLQVFIVMLLLFSMIWSPFSNHKLTKKNYLSLLRGLLPRLPFIFILAYGGVIFLFSFMNVPLWRSMSDVSFYETWGSFSLFTWLAWGMAHTGAFFEDKKAVKQYMTQTFQLWIGESTGLLSELSHGASLAPKQHISLSLSDAAQNIAIFGAIGAGKTTRAVHPLLLQLLDQKCGGLIFDIKGDFQYALKKFTRMTQASSKVHIIGEEGTPLNLIQGLTPEMAASFLKSALMLNGNSRVDNFWIDTATELCRNTLVFLSFLPHYYNLAVLHDYLFNAQQQIKINIEIDHILPTLTEFESRLLTSYLDYHEKIFAHFDDKVRSGVLASVAQILSPFQHPALIDLFCKDSSLSMENVVNGQIFFINLPLSRWGLGGKVAYNFIKLRFFNIMQQRATQPNWNQSNPVFFLCDEYQEIVSSNKEGLSDLNFWDKSRSSKTIGIISTQSVSSFYAAIGDRDMANAILQNFRQKICFRSEDQATLDLLNRLTGHVEVINRSMSQQQGNSGTGIFRTHSNQSKSETISYVNRPVVDPQLIRKLGPNQAIALLSLQGQSYDDVFNMLPVYL